MNVQREGPGNQASSVQATHTLHTSTFTLPASHCEAMGWEGRVGGVRCVGGGGGVRREGVGAWPQAG